MKEEEEEGVGKVLEELTMRGRGAATVVFVGRGMEDARGGREGGESGGVVLRSIFDGGWGGTPRVEVEACIEGAERGGEPFGVVLRMRVVLR